MTLDPWHIFTANFGHLPKPYTACVTLLDMLLYFILSFNVGRARATFKVRAPATDGPDEFQRIFRTQMNTMEQLVLHLPLLWIAAFAMSDVFAAAFGAVWWAARILYARGYYLKAKRRTKGFMIALLVNLILLLGAIAGTMASI